MDRGRAASTIAAVTVGTVLADSAVVSLALPEILHDLHGTVPQVAWVLIGFNLALALAAVPAAGLCTRIGPGRLAAGGALLLAAASAGCAAARSMDVLIGARAVQAVGGAAVLAGLLEVLVADLGRRRGIRRWTAAGVVGTAAGPVVGGLLTQALHWQAVFLAQIPVALLAVLTGWSRRSATPSEHPPPAARRRPALAGNLALGLLSAASSSALFLLVLLIVQGWRHSPAAAAVTVSAVPAAAAVAVPVARLAKAGTRAETVAGTVLVAGGLAGLALLPAARLWWTVPAQVLLGLGLGLSLDALTAGALHERVPRALHAGTTVAARHAGVVTGLLLLVPVFTADLHREQKPAQEAVAGLVLDAPLTSATKLALAARLADRLTASDERIPDLRPAFAAVPAGERPAAAALATALDDQLERAATQALHRSFLLAAALAAAALLPLLSMRQEPR